MSAPHALDALLFRHRLLVMLVAFTVALGSAVLSTHLPAATVFAPLARLCGRDPTLLGTGLLCALAFVLRMLGESQLGAAVYAQGQTAALRDSGVFGRTRNPLYLGNALFFAALVLLWAPATVALPLAALFFAALHRMVLHEEVLLRQQLGAPYAAYLERVPRWLPLGPGGGASVAPTARAVVSNLGLLSFALFRLGVALGGPERLLGLLNLVCVLVWAVAVLVQRARALRAPPANAPPG